MVRPPNQTSTLSAPSPFLGRIGARLVLTHTLVLVVVLGVAAYFVRLATIDVIENAIHERVLGELKSLDDEAEQKGVDHLAFTVTKRTTLWRGFEYRLTNSGGIVLGGSLPAHGAFAAWSRVTEPSDGDQFLVFTKRLSNGNILSVGQDMSIETRQLGVLTRTLLWCGAFGIAVGFAVSLLFAASAWRRVSALARAAREASTGRLDVRVTTRPNGDDIDDLANTFNTMLTEIGNLVSQVQHVSTAIAHDLRIPLTRVRQRVERLAAMRHESPEILLQLRQIETELDELGRSFDAMLQLAEIENAPSLACDTVLDVGEIVARVASAYRPEIEESGRAFVAHIASGTIRGDQQLISHAIANLLDNAMRHTPGGTPIEIGVAASGEGATLFVADCGPGIPADQRADVLERFHKLDGSRARRGSGLGLAIVAAVAKRHDAALALLDAQPGLKVELHFRRVAAQNAA